MTGAATTVFGLAGLAALLAACDPGAPVTATAAPAPPVLRVTPVTDTHHDRGLLIMVNTPDELYRVDPATFDVTLMGTFTFPDGVPDRITDVAMDRKGRMWAVGFEAVYRLDPTTFECTLLARHPGHALNALSIMTSAMLPGRETPDVMLAAESKTQAVYQVDPSTGALTVTGDLGGGLSSGGDLTWAPGVGAVLITTDMAGYEGLSRLDPDTFAAHPLDGGWAFQKVRGLTMIPDGLLGVSEQGEMIQIDPTTGAATLRKVHPLVFYGGAIGWDDRPTPIFHP